MKKIIALLLSASLVCFFASTANAANARDTEAKVTKVTGGASASIPGQSGTVALSAGMSLPVGTVVTTGANGEVLLEPFVGTVAEVRANTTVSLDKLSIEESGGVVTKQTTQIGITTGSLLSTLDPAKTSINDYKVRTPRGIAAARGTIFLVTVTLQGDTFGTLRGSIVVTPFDQATGTYGSPTVVDVNQGIRLDREGLRHILTEEQMRALEREIRGVITDTARETPGAPARARRPITISTPLTPIDPVVISPAGGK